MLDENLSPRLRDALKQVDNEIDILRVGDENTPPFGTSDPEILGYLVANRRMLITDNRGTIPDHLDEHYASGGDSHWGIVWIRPETRFGELLEALHLIWAATEAEEWIDRSDWIPF